MSGDVHVRLCVQRRLACSAGVSPAGVKVRSPVAWIAGWTRGTQHQIEARRGKWLNVVGAWLNSGHLFTVSLWESMTTSLFGSFLGILLNKTTKPLTVILDNASIHTARALQPYLKIFREQGAGFNAVFRIFSITRGNHHTTLRRLVGLLGQARRSSLLAQRNEFHL